MTAHQRDSAPVALITGGSAGLGLALTQDLHGRGWRVITDARHAERLQAAHEPSGRLVRLAGDVADPAHRSDLIRAVEQAGRLDLLVHNASWLGPTPLRPLSDLTPEDLLQLWTINVVAAHQLTVALLQDLRHCDGLLVSISSDAALEHYPGWGGYGATKAALDHLTLTWAAETGLTGYAVDPGDMRTAMHQSAFPGEDIGDRPLPETVVPHLLALIEHRPAPGRYRAREVPVPAPDWVVSGAGVPG